MAVSFKNSLNNSTMSASLNDSNMSVSTTPAIVSTTNGVQPINESFTRCTDGRYVWYDDYVDVNLSTVNSNKDITVDNSQINLTQEANSQYIPFKMSRYYDGVDLMKMNIQFHYVNSRGDEDYSTPINVSYSADSICFGWLVNEKVTALEGNVAFEIVAIGTNSNGDNYVWKTRPNGRLNIIKSLSGNGIIEPSTDWYNSFVANMNIKIREAQQFAEDAAASANSVDVETIKAGVIGSFRDELESNYYDKNEVQQQIENFDGLSELSVQYEPSTGQLTFLNGIDEICNTTINGVANLNAEYVVKNEKNCVVFKNNDEVLFELEMESINPPQAWVDSFIEAIKEEIKTLEGLRVEYADETGILTFFDDQTELCNVTINGLANLSASYSVSDTDMNELTFFNGEEELFKVTLDSINPTEEWTSSLTQTIADGVSSSLKSINDKITELEESLSTATSDIETIKSDVTSINETLGTMQTAIEGNTSNISDVKSTVSTLQSSVGTLNTEVSGVKSSISENASSIKSINSSIASINQSINNIDTAPRTTYDATYGDVELDDGSTAEYMFTLWKTENGVREVQDRFQIMGGGGTGSTTSVMLKIAYVEGFTTPIVSTIEDRVMIKYDFTGQDSAGDTDLDGTASWKVGNRVIATQDIATGVNTFDITDFVTIGDNKVLLTITHSTGAIATKAWTVKLVDVRLASTFDDTRKYVANEPVEFTFTPYGGVNKTVHFLLDNEEIATKISPSTAAGLSDSYAIPAKPHGTHLFEMYMTADVNGKQVESNHIKKDIIWYDESSRIPLIGCSMSEFTLRQYEAINIQYTVFDPDTETPSVVLKSTYVNEEDEVVEEYTSNITMSSNTAVWQYKTSVIGTHTLTITCGETVKTLTATVTELGISVSPITANLAFDFNPVGHSNNDTNRLWSHGDVAMTVSDNFDWINGGYQIDENGDQCFCIKAGTSAQINYLLFADDAKINGKEFKLVFKTKNVSDSSTTFLSCLSESTGKKIGIEMKAQEATIYAKEDKLPLPYAEDEIVEFEFNISTSSSEVPMVMGYEDGVSTRPLVYDDTHDFQQYANNRQPISLGSPDCDLYIYRFKVYNKSLSDRDILNNFIADARSAEEMISRFERNQIYKEGILDPDYLAEVCPQLRIIKLEVPHFTKDKKDKVYDAKIQSICECIYKNGDPIYDNWIAYDITHSGRTTTCPLYMETYA